MQLPYAHDITSAGKADEPPQHINTIFVETCVDADDNVAEDDADDEDEDDEVDIPLSAFGFIKSNSRERRAGFDANDKDAPQAGSTEKSKGKVTAHI